MFTLHSGQCSGTLAYVFYHPFYGPLGRFSFHGRSLFSAEIKDGTEVGQAVGNFSKANRQLSENNERAKPEERGRPACPEEFSLCSCDLTLEREAGHWFNFIAG